MREAGIYIHIPFCAAKCPYCNFYSLPHSQSKWQEYADTLCQVLEDWQGRGVTAKTLYFGGGTPSLLPAELLLQIRDTVCRVFGAAGGNHPGSQPRPVYPGKTPPAAAGGI